MSFTMMSLAVEKEYKNSAQKLTLIILSNYLNDKTRQCNPSHSALAKKCCMSVSSLKVQLKALEKKGDIKIINRSKDNVKLSNQYILNLENKSSIILTKNSRNNGSEYDVSISLDSNLKNTNNSLNLDSQNLTDKGHNLTKGTAESDYKTINETNISLSLSEIEKKCFLWSQKKPFWKNIITDINIFKYHYQKNTKNGCRAQFEEDESKRASLTSKSIKSRSKQSLTSIKETKYTDDDNIAGFKTNELTK